MTATKNVKPGTEFNLIAWQDKLAARFRKSERRAGRLIWAQAQKQLVALGYAEREAYAIVGDVAEVAENENRIAALGKYA